ncbi:MAG TPA: hypothetical protein VGJ20_37130 [Xanthobacteraceae bacterium]|jgi:hypothetical protein
MRRLGNGTRITDLFDSRVEMIRMQALDDRHAAAPFHENGTFGSSLDRIEMLP